MNSSFYRIPAPETVKKWAERTPDDFVFHVKAHALMTGQPTEVARLPEPIIDALPAALAEKARGRAVSFATMERASFVGFALVVGLFVIGLSNDIGRLGNGGFGIR